MATMGREAIRLWPRTADQQLPKPAARLEPVFKEAVERQHEREGPVVSGTRDKQRLARWGEGEKFEVLALRRVNDPGRIRSRQRGTVCPATIKLRARVNQDESCRCAVS